MAFDPNLGDAISRVRFRLGDTTDPSFMPGGETVYQALLDMFAGDETKTVRAAAQSLAAYYANQPDSVSSAGESVSWSSRVAQWNRIALGVDGGAGSPNTPITFVPASYRYRGEASDEFSW